MTLPSSQAIVNSLRVPMPPGDEDDDVGTPYGDDVAPFKPKT